MHFDPNHLSIRDICVLAPIILGCSLLQVVLAIVIGEQALRWAGLLVNTAIMFGYFTYDSREKHDDRTFWLLCLLLLSLHLMVFGFVISIANEWKPVWFMLMVPEFVIFVALRNRHF